MYASSGARPVVETIARSRLPHGQPFQEYGREPLLAGEPHPWVAGAERGDGPRYEGGVGRGEGAHPQPSARHLP